MQICLVLESVRVGWRVVIVVVQTVQFFVCILLAGLTWDWDGHPPSPPSPLTKYNLGLLNISAQFCLRLECGTTGVEEVDVQTDRVVCGVYSSLFVS